MMLQKYNPKNGDIKVWVKDQLYPRSQAKVSVFDSVVQGGDAVWEGLRLYPEGIFCLDRHLQRLIESAKALAFTDIPSQSEIQSALFQTLAANQMRQDCHIRLTLTRGEKITSGMDPRLNCLGATLIILAEWKPPVYDNSAGIKVISTSIQRNSPLHLDSKIHHNNLLNNILAKIQANVAGVDAGLMLDNQGFLAELNGSNVFLIKNQKILTPHAHACLPGITRGLVIEICQKIGLHCLEKNLSLTEAYTSEFAFAAGTMGELTPISTIDGRTIADPLVHPIFDQIKQQFEQEIKGLCTPLPTL